MKILQALAVLCILGACFAQKTVTVAPVQGGQAQLTFSPSSLIVTAGENVTFTYTIRGQSPPAHGFQFTVDTCSAPTENCSACAGASPCGPAPVCESNNTSPDAPFAQPALSSNWVLMCDTAIQRTLVFNTTGTYFYYCQPHCAAGMWGSVTVQAPTTPPATTAAPNTFCIAPELNCQTTGRACTIQRPSNISVTWNRCSDIDDVCYSAAGNNDGVCTAQARDQQTCSQQVDCFDSTYEVKCLSNNFCGNDDVFAPGEECVSAANQIAFYGGNGGCYSGQCTLDTGTPAKYRCLPALRANESCAGNLATACNASHYCDPDTDLCTLRKAPGIACNDDDECQQDLACLNDVCALPMSLPIGSQCSQNNRLYCAPGLICANVGGGNRVCQAIPAGSTDRPCNQTNSCPNGYSCECDFTSNNPQAAPPTARCKPICTLTQAHQNDIRSYGSCLKRNNCLNTVASEVLSFYRGGCVDKHCYNEYKAYLAATNACQGVRSLRCSATSSATSLLFSVAAILITILAMSF